MVLCSRDVTYLTRGETCVLNESCEVGTPIAMQKYSHYRPG